MRISAAVVSLVVGNGDIPRHPQQWGIGKALDRRVQCRRPLQGMGLQNLEFLLVHLAWFQQDIAGNGHFAYVVQRAGHVDQLDVVFVCHTVKVGHTAQLIRKHAAVVANSFQV